jgi:hypothetical protein
MFTPSVNWFSTKHEGHDVLEPNGLPQPKHSTRAALPAGIDVSVISAILVRFTSCEDLHHEVSFSQASDHRAKTWQLRGLTEW